MKKLIGDILVISIVLGVFYFFGYCFLKTANYLQDEGNKYYNTFLYEI